jgi:hypothetical protein
LDQRLYVLCTINRYFLPLQKQTNMLIYTINGYAFQFFISTMKGATFRHFFHPLSHLFILLKNSPAVTAALANSVYPFLCGAVLEQKLNWKGMF